MQGFNIVGRAFAVCEDLRVIAEQNKGKTVAQYMYEKRKERLDRAVAAQFGMTEDEYRAKLGKYN